MKRIHMNHRIKQKRPRRGVVRVSDKSGHVDGNEFVFKLKDGTVLGRVVYSRKGCPEIETHEVRAWVELTDAVDVWLK
jgi:hypothetical protein